MVNPNPKIKLDIYDINSIFIGRKSNNEHLLQLNVSEMITQNSQERNNPRPHFSRTQQISENRYICHYNTVQLGKKCINF